MKKGLILAGIIAAVAIIGFTVGDLSVVGQFCQDPKP